MIIADDKIATATIVNGVTLLAPVEVLIQDVESDLWFNTVTGLYNSAVAVPIEMALVNAYTYETTLYWNIKLGQKRFVLTHNGGSLVEVAYAEAKEKQFFSLDPDISFPNAVGFMPMYSSGVPAMICTSLMAPFSFDPINGIQPLPQISFDTIEIRPGWTFTAKKALTDGVPTIPQPAHPYTYILGTATDGITIEDALIVYAAGYPPTVYTHGDWGINSSGSFFTNPVLNHTLDQVQMLIVDTGVLKILRWNRITGAFLGATSSDVVAVQNFENTYATDDIYIYCVMTYNWVVPTTNMLLQLDAVTGAKIREVDLAELFRIHKFDRPACAWVYAFDGKIYVSADTDSSVTAIFNSSLSLINIFAHSYKGAHQGMAFGNGYIYTALGTQYASLCMTLSIMDKTSKVALISLPGGDTWQPAMNSDVYTCVLVSKGVVFLLTKDSNDQLYINAVCVDAPNFGAMPPLSDIEASAVLAKESTLLALKLLSGAYTVTVQFYRTATTTPIPDVMADVYDATETARLNGTQLKSDVNGRLTFNRDNGTYKVRAMLAGFNFTTGTVVVAGGNEPITIYGAAAVADAPAPVGAMRVYDFFFMPDGVTPMAADPVAPAKIINLPYDYNGRLHSGQSLDLTYNAGTGKGYWDLAPGATVEFDLRNFRDRVIQKTLPLTDPDNEIRLEDIV